MIPIVFFTNEELAHSAQNVKVELVEKKLVGLDGKLHDLENK